ncbi:hypothetical protein [Flavobacterium anhuiense]
MRKIRSLLRETFVLEFGISEIEYLKISSTWNKKDINVILETALAVFGE